MFTSLMALMTLCIGFLIGEKVYNKKRLSPATVPIASLVSEFEEYARLIEGGELSIEADEVIKALKAHAEQKYLKSATIKKINGLRGKREDDWSDVRCFEKEMEKATNDDERLIIIRHWLVRYNFTQAFKTWCIQRMESADNRTYLRTLFEQEEQ